MRSPYLTHHPITPPKCLEPCLLRLGDDARVGLQLTYVEGVARPCDPRSWGQYDVRKALGTFGRSIRVVRKESARPRYLQDGGKEHVFTDRRRLAFRHIGAVLLLSPPQAHGTPTRGLPRFPDRPVPRRRLRMVMRTWHRRQQYT